MRMLRLWGRGTDLLGSYRFLQQAFVAIVVLLVLNLIVLGLALTHHDKDGLAATLSGIGVVVNLAIAGLGLYGAHGLSVLAERAEIYRHILDTSLLPALTNRKDSAPMKGA